MQEINLELDLEALWTEQQATTLWSALAALPKLVTLFVGVGGGDIVFHREEHTFCQAFFLMTQIR